MFKDGERPGMRNITTGEDGLLLDVHEQSCDLEQLFSGIQDPELSFGTWTLFKKVT